MSGTRDRNLPANLKLRRPGPVYNQVEMEQAFRLIEQHWHLQLIPGTTTETEEPPEEPPEDDEFPTLDLEARYDGDHVTTASRPSSTADGYSAIQADAAYDEARTIIDLSGNNNTLTPTLVVEPTGPMVRPNVRLTHASIITPGGGLDRPMSSVHSAGMSFTAATIFCVARVASTFNQTQQAEFQVKPAFAIGTALTSGPSTDIGGTIYSGPVNYEIATGWSGKTQTDTPFDIVVITWDGTSLAAYVNGYAIPAATAVALSGTIVLTEITAFNGQVEWLEWGFYSRKLAGSEIKAIFTVLGPKYEVVVPL